MKKIILAAVSGLLAIGCTSASVPVENDEILSPSDTESSETQTSEMNTEIVMNQVDTLYNNEDPSSLSEWSTAVAAIRILSIDGSDNYNENLDAYGYVYTYGTFETIETFKGNIPEGTNEFTFHGGTIPYDRYVLSMNAEQIEKHEAMMETKPEYVTAVWEKEICAEPGKIYLAFMINNDNTPRISAYNIIGYQGGLREIQTDGTGSLENALVFDPFAEEWQKLSEVISKIQ